MNEIRVLKRRYRELRSRLADRLPEDKQLVSDVDHLLGDMRHELSGVRRERDAAREQLRQLRQQQREEPLVVEEEPEPDLETAAELERLQGRLRQSEKNLQVLFSMMPGPWFLGPNVMICTQHPRCVAPFDPGQVIADIGRGISDPEQYLTALVQRIIGAMYWIDQPTRQQVERVRKEVLKQVQGCTACIAMLTHAAEAVFGEE